MNKDPFAKAFILLLWIMLVDALIFTSLTNVILQLMDLARERANFPSSEKSFDFWVSLNPIGITILGLTYIVIKSVFGYYPSILAYFYIRKMSTANFTPHKIILPLIGIFFISVSLFLAYSFLIDPENVGISSTFAYDTELGVTWYIAFFASLAAPFVVKVILTWMNK